MKLHVFSLASVHLHHRALNTTLGQFFHPFYQDVGKGNKFNDNP